MDFSQFSWKDWRTGVPSAQTVIEQSTTAPGKLAGRMAQSAFDSAQLVTGITWGSMQARTDAMPAGSADVASFGTMGGLLDALPVGSFDGLGESAIGCVNGAGSCGELIFDAQMAAIAKVWESVATDVPILNWIVQGVAFGVTVGKIIWLEAQDPPEPTAAPLMLDQDADQDAGERIIGAASSADWTGLWMPPHDGHGETYLQAVDVEYGTGFKGQRLWLGGPVNGATVGGGEGLIPGQDGAAQQWQTRLEQASTGSTRLDALANFLGIPISAGSGDASSIGKTTTYGIGYFRPAIPQLNQLMWAEVSKVGSEAMFRVNADRLQEGWDGYWSRWQQVFNHIVKEGTETQQGVVWNILSGTSLPLPVEWNAALRPRVTQGGTAQGQGDVSIIPERYRILQNGGMKIVGGSMDYLGSHTGCMPCWIPDYRYVWGDGWYWSVTNEGTTRWTLDNFRERQEYALKTLMVAYLTGDEPGLGGKGSAMFIEWETNRDKLLSSPWKNSVDMERVPKVDHTGTGDWRKLLIEKRLGGLQVSLAMAPPPRLHAPLNPWGQGNFPSKFTDTKRATFGKLDDLGGDGVGGGAAGLGVVALMALAFGMRR